MAVNRFPGRPPMPVPSGTVEEPWWSWDGSKWVMTAQNPNFVPPWTYPPKPSGSTPGPSLVNATAALRSGTFIQPGASMPLVYGQQRVVGQVMWASTGDTLQADFYVAISEGEIDSIVKTFINGVDVSLYGSLITITTTHLGTSSQSPDAGLSGVTTSGFPRTAYVRISIFSPGSGQPWWYNFQNDGGQVNEISFELKGVKVAPNGDGSGTPAWTDNFALCFRDWLCDPVHGVGIPSAMLDGANWDQAAADCTSLGYKLNTVLTDTSSTAIQQYDALRVCANAELYMNNGKLCLFIDQPQSTVVVAFDDTLNCGPVSYEPLTTRNMPTRVILTYSDSANWSTYTPSNAPQVDTVTVDNPGVATGAVPLRIANYTVDGITNVTQAHKVATYILNNGAVPMRYRFSCGWVGVLLTRGSLCTLSTSDGLVNQEILVLDVTRKDTGGYEIVARQYESTIYSSVAITGDAPPTNNDGPRYRVPADVNALTSSIDVIARGGLRWAPSLAPVPYVDKGPYGAGFWSLAGGATGLTASKVNDGILTGASTVAATFPSGVTDSWLVFDAGSGQVKAFGNWLMTAFGALADFPMFRNDPDIQFSDDGSTWFRIGDVSPFAFAWANDTPVTGYSQTTRWGTGYAGGHRYWRIGFASPRAPITDVKITEVQSFDEMPAQDIAYYEVWAGDARTDLFAPPAIPPTLIATVPAYAIPAGGNYSFFPGTLLTPVATGTAVRYHIQATIVTVTKSGGRSATNSSGGEFLDESIDLVGAAHVVPPGDGTTTNFLNAAGQYVPAGGAGSFVTLQGSTPGTPDTGNFNVDGTGIMGTAGFIGPGADTAPLDASIATSCIIGSNHGGETAILTLYNESTAADGDSAGISFLFGGYTEAVANIRAIIEDAGSALTGIGFGTFSAGGYAERHRMRNDGRVGFGIHSPFATSHLCSQPTWPFGQAIIEQDVAGNGGSEATVNPTLYFRKERGSIDTPVRNNTDDLIGSIIFSGYDTGGGTSSTLDSRTYVESGMIRVTAVGTVASTRLGTKMEFFTGTDAAPTVQTLAMTIDEEQHVKIGTDVSFYPADNPTLYVTGSGPNDLINFTNLSGSANGAQIIARSQGSGGSGATANNDWIALLGARGFDGSAFLSGSSAKIIAQATQAFTSSHAGTRWSIHTTPNNSVTSAEALGIEQDGLVTVASLTASSAVYTDSSKRLTSTPPAGLNYADHETPSGTINSSNVTFTLAHSPSPAGSLILAMQGQIQRQGTDFTLSTNTITFTNAPPTGVTLEAWYRY